MDVNYFNAYCKSLPHTTHVVQWGGSHVWKVGGKMFAVFSYPKLAVMGITFKCSSFSFSLLIEQTGCRSAPYLHSPWVQCISQETLDDASLKLYLKESYRIIFDALTKKKQKELLARR
jgi:predicted DNA-binding protein (MmcQ/YjbR family)